MIIGDLNSYAKEDPIDVLKDAGYTDLLDAFAPEGIMPYTYTFDATQGYLDHALADADLLPYVTGAAAWNINADEVPAIDYLDVRVNGRFRTAEVAERFYDPSAFRSLRPRPGARRARPRPGTGQHRADGRGPRSRDRRGDAGRRSARDRGCGRRRAHDRLRRARQRDRGRRRRRRVHLHPRDRVRRRRHLRGDGRGRSRWQRHGHRHGDGGRGRHAASDDADRQGRVQGRWLADFTDPMFRNQGQCVA